MRYFGTDGIRGIVNEFLTPELAFRLGNAVGKMVNGKVFIAKDTRNSGDMLEAALIAGITSAGADVYRCGIMPTPALALITKLEDAAGIMISASHNPPEYNGLKVIMKGYKLPDSLEERIENEMQDVKYNSFEKVGRVIDYRLAEEEYFNYIKELYKNLDLSGLKIVMDVANGATYNLNPKILEYFGAKIEVVNNEPDGFNINKDCGSTHPENIKNYIVNGKIGILHDGDGDRCIFLDENGQEFHGDKIIGLTALQLKKEGRLKNDKVVVTILSNMGLERFLNENSIDVVRTKVGDRYVLEEMLKENITLGGERSGHIIYLDRSTTGDGLITALETLSAMVNSGKRLADLSNLIPDYPQVMINVKVNDKEVYKSKEVFEKLKSIKDYRVIVRPSGTEPVVRVLVEGPDMDESTIIANDIADLIKKFDNKKE
ncbi:phosphoglucosamine mutase [Thermosipho africanus Ob7]|uniref:phosphoglucosamine mutase n=1 Tax=Thermosipho africanus TaxID=2421 RepID=UPI000E0B4197|nr:phosphoglucosamine mutase [Thermosipho africanus]RDI92061.1 phosphoglucosamine mutase [Thermosipho africanus Ob7]